MFPPKDVVGQMSLVGFGKEDKRPARTLRWLADAGIGMPHW